MVVDERFFPTTAMPDQDWWQALWPAPEEVLSTLGIKAGMTVVDLCCGDGLFTAPMCRLVEPGRVFGADIDPELLQQAKDACAGMTNCAWVEGDARRLAEMLTEKVDYVLIANTFHGVPDKDGLARVVRSVLEPGGRFAVVNWHPLPREETPVLDKPRGPATAYACPRRPCGRSWSRRGSSWSGWCSYLLTTTARYSCGPARIPSRWQRRSIKIRYDS